MASLRVVFLVLVLFAMTNESHAYARSCPAGSTLVHQWGFPTFECMWMPYYCYCAAPCTNDQIKYENTCQDCAVANAVPSEENLNDSGERTSCECSDTSLPFDGFLEPTVLNCVSTSACATESGFFCEAAMIACDDGCEKGFVYAANSDTGYPTHNVEVDTATVEIGKLPVGYDDTTSGLWSVRLNRDETRGVLVNKATATVQLWDTSTGTIFKTLPTQIMTDYWINRNADCLNPAHEYYCLDLFDNRPHDFVNPTGACWSNDGTKVFVAHSTGIARYDESSGWIAYYSTSTYVSSQFQDGGVLDCLHTDSKNGDMTCHNCGTSSASKGDRLIIVRPEAIIELEDVSGRSYWHPGCNNYPQFCALGGSGQTAAEPFCTKGCHYFEDSAGFEKIDITNDQSKIIAISMTNGNQRLFTWNRATLQRTEHTTVDMWSSLHAGLRCSLAQPCLRGVAFARGGQKAYVAQPNGIRLYDLTDGSSEVVDLSRWSTEGEYHYTVAENTLYSGSQASYIDTTSIFVDDSGKYAYITDPNTNGGAGAVRKVELGVRLGVQSTQCDAEHCCPGDGFKYDINDPICPIGCPPGQELDGNSACIPCAKNYWKGHHGQEACSPCRVNSGTDGQTGANAENLCQCIPGYFNSPEGSAVDACQPCAVGTYKATFANLLACDACPDHATTIGEAHDEYTDCVCTAGHTGSDASTCAPCAAGTYKSAAGFDACTPCFAGATSPAGSTSIDACTCEAPFVVSNQACVCNVGTHLVDPGTCDTNPYPGSSSDRYIIKQYSDTDPCYVFGQQQNGVWIWSGKMPNIVLRYGVDIRFAAADGSNIDGMRVSQYGNWRSMSWWQWQGCGSDVSCRWKLPQAKYDFWYYNNDAEQCGQARISIISNNGVPEDGISCLFSSPMTCQDCAADSYKAETGDQTCTPCPESTSHELLGATSAAACECDPGLHLVDSVCTACDANTYKTTIGNTGCVPCPDNTHSQAGSTELWQCVPKSGFFGSGVNLQACPANTLSLDADPAAATEAGTDVETCLCVAGYGGDPSCPVYGDCETGWTRISATKCVLFNTPTCCNNYYPNSLNYCVNLNALPAMPVDQAEADALTDMTPYGFWLGYTDTDTEGVFVAESGEPITWSWTFESGWNKYNNDERDCLVVRGYRSSTKGQVLSAYCTPATGPGKATFADNMCEKKPALNSECAFSSLECTVCPAGSYKSAVGKLECTYCPANTNSIAGSTSMDACECNAGYTGADCAPCAANMYKSETGSAACTPCPQNTEAPEGSTSVDACTCVAGSVPSENGGCELCGENMYASGSTCAACPPNTISSAGSASEEDCLCAAGYTFSDPTQNLARARPTGSSGAIGDQFTVSKLVNGVTHYPEAWRAGTPRGSQWAKIDMQSVRAVASVKLHPAAFEWYASSLANGVQVRVGDVDEPYSNPICATQAVFSGGWNHNNWYTLPCLASGRYLFLTWPNDCSGAYNCQGPAMMEVQIFAPSCVTCGADTYKSTVGNDACLPCAAGYVAAAGSTECQATFCGAGFVMDTLYTCHDAAQVSSSSVEQLNPCRVDSYFDATLQECKECPKALLTKSNAQIGESSCLCPLHVGNLYHDRHYDSVHWIPPCVECSEGEYTPDIGALACKPGPLADLLVRKPEYIFSFTATLDTTLDNFDETVYITAVHNMVSGTVNVDYTSFAAYPLNMVLRIQAVRTVPTSNNAMRRLLSGQIEVDTEYVIHHPDDRRRHVGTSSLYPQTVYEQFESYVNLNALNTELSTDRPQHETNIGFIFNWAHSAAGYTASSMTQIQLSYGWGMYCAPGYFTPGTPPGFRSGPDPGGIYNQGSECLPCPIGWFKYYAGNWSCSICQNQCYEEGPSDNGNWVPEVIDENECGFSTETGGVTQWSKSFCSKCASTPQPAYDQLYCPCAAGYYSHQLTEDYGYKRCVKCAPGKFKSVASDSECTACTDHASSARGSTSITNCTCISGYFGDHTGCNPAPVGSWSENGELFPCPANSTTASIASSSPMDCLCLPGFTLLNGEPRECAQCSANTYKNESSNIPCSACPLNSQSASGSKSMLNCECTSGHKRIHLGSNTIECHLECPAGFEEGYEDVYNCPADALTTQCFNDEKNNAPAHLQQHYDVSLPKTFSRFQLWAFFGGSFKCCSSTGNLFPEKGWNPAGSGFDERLNFVYDECGYTSKNGNCTWQRITTCLPCLGQNYKTNSGDGQCQPCHGHYQSANTHNLQGWWQAINPWYKQFRGNLDWNLSLPGGYNTGGWYEYQPGGINTVSSMSVGIGREYDVFYASTLSGWGNWGKTQLSTKGYDLYGGAKGPVNTGLTNVQVDYMPGITGCFCRQGFYNVSVLPPDGAGCLACPDGKFNSHWNSSACYTCYTTNPATGECEVTDTSWNFGTFCARYEEWVAEDYNSRYYHLKEFYAWASPQRPTAGEYHTFETTMCKVQAGMQEYNWNVKNYPMMLPYVGTNENTILYSYPSPHAGVEPCPPNTWNNGSFMQCQPCANSVYDGVGGTSASQCVCGPGFTQVDGACVGCAIGSFSSANSNDACTPCSSVLPHSTTLAGGATSLDACVCEPGYTLEDGQCVACASGGTKHFPGNMACVQCPANAALPVGSPHQQDSCRCNAGYAGNQFECSACALSFFKSASGNFACQACGIGTLTYNTASTTCVSAGCLPGKRKKAGSETCESCAQGKFKSAYGDGSCSVCSGARSRSKKGATSSKDCACPGKQIALAVEPAIIKELGAFIEDESTIETEEYTSSHTIQADSNRALKSITVGAGAEDVHISVDGVLVFSCTSDCARFTQELSMPNAQNQIQYIGSGTIAFKFYTEREIIFESEPAWMAGNRAAARKLVLKSKLRPGQGLYSRSQSKFNSEKCVRCVRGLICKDYAIEADA